MMFRLATWNFKNMPNLGNPSCGSVSTWVVWEARRGMEAGLPSNLVARRWEAPHTGIEILSYMLVFYREELDRMHPTNSSGTLTPPEFYMTTRYWVQKATFGAPWIHRSTSKLSNGTTKIESWGSSDSFNKSHNPVTQACHHMVLTNVVALPVLIGQWGTLPGFWCGMSDENE